MSYTYALGRMKAQCMLDKKYGECSGNCSQCERYGRLQRCYNTLNDFEKMAVDDAAKFQFKDMDKMYKIDRSNKRWKLFMKTVAIGIILWIVFSVVKCKFGDVLDKMHAFPMGISQDLIIFDDPDKIFLTLKETHANIKDTNGDGKVNCTDYAITFKKEWDKKYKPEDCEIVRNENTEGDFHHLFVRCKKDGEWLCVEPQAKTRQYSMDIHWTDKQYKKDLNIYGETDYWLAKCKI